MNYSLVRSRRHSLSLQVDKSGAVVARAPLYYPKFLIDRFVASKAAWVAKRLAEHSRPQPQPVEYCTIEQLKEFIRQQVKHYGSVMDLTPRSLRFTQVHSYWGTCSPTGVLSFNLALRFTREETITYVVIHELAHLRYRGHGVHFWKLVRQYCPQANDLRRQLRLSGHAIT